MVVSFVGKGAEVEPNENKKGADLKTAAATPTTAAIGTAQLEALLKNFKWRSVGPANMGGRVSDIAVVEEKNSTIYVGLGTGGLWKTINNGTSWEPIFDNQSVASIGAVAVSKSDPNLVWVGTGEPQGRNSSSWGDGVYKSTDAGRTWTNMGLKDSHTISRIVINPNDNNTVYVAAVGHLWGVNKERGLYKTTDGGKTWAHVLYINEKTGIVDLAIDPSDPNTLYAAAYQRLRTPWSFTSGGPDSGLHKTTDGGKTWRRLAEGLPSGPLGRIGVAVYQKDPNVIYTVIESDKGGRDQVITEKSRDGGVFRSEDKGETWRRVSDINPRPFYYSQIRIDPKDDNHIYVLGARFYLSDDGGKTFRSNVARTIHGDNHALWIDPSNPDHMILGSDGGIYFTYDHTKTWDFVNNIAIGEFYQVSVDMRKPYYICGGLQDNGSWCGPSATRNQDGITNADWYRVGGGDGFYVVNDPTDPNIVYAESQGGNAFRLNLKTGERKNLRPIPKEGEPGFRFNWNSPLVISHHDPKTLYFGGNRLFKLTERGDRVEPISPDLTTQDPQKMNTAGSYAESYCTIVTISESPLNPQLLWVGTDDGNLQVTRDGGLTWTNVVRNIPGLARHLYVSRVEASHFEEGAAYVSIDGHRNDLFAPLVFLTADFGQTWHSIANNLPLGGPVKVIREDLKNRNLLFTGTEFGIFVSFDRGGRWLPLKHGLPTVAVDDILIHPRERDLIIGTHGRSIYVLDDITPLEEITSEVLSSDVHLFNIRPVANFHYLPAGAAWGGRIFKAPNPPFGALIQYYLKTYTGTDVKISITDSAGKTVRELDGTRYPGPNRVVWDLQPTPSETFRRPDFERQIELVKPGEYNVTLSVGKEKQTTKVLVEEPGT